MNSKFEDSNTTFTPEYAYPVGKLDYISRQHIERYLFACSLLGPGQRVLDIACGAGYGTAMLANRGCNVVGADYDIAAIRETRESGSHAKFAIADVLTLPFSDGQFDAVVSFETIEHVVGGVQFLNEMDRVLKPKGLLICSTPNIRYTAHPPFHLKEYEPSEFYGLVEERFTILNRYGQYITRKDRLIDMFVWKTRPFYVAYFTRIKSLLFKIGLGNRIRSIKHLVIRPRLNTPTGGTTLDAIRSNEFGSKEETNPKSGVYNQGSYYRVRNLKGDKLLRIMIAVTVKN